MKLGFTGTRQGMTSEQLQRVREIVYRLMSPAGGHEAHHGDCIGADAEFVAIANELAEVHARPGPDVTMRARTTAHRYHDPKTHFARNRDIVNETDILLATPRLMTEEQRGGTWYTINYARKVGKPVIIVWPDGMEQAESRLTEMKR